MAYWNSLYFSGPWMYSNQNQRNKVFWGQWMSKMDSSSCMINIFSTENLREPVGVKKILSKQQTANFRDIFLVIERTGPLSWVFPNFLLSFFIFLIFSWFPDFSDRLDTLHYLVWMGQTSWSNKKHKMPTIYRHTSFKVVTKIIK